jgi:hypothetical protein
LTLLASAGCFRAPEVVVVDRATVLEQEASGSFEELERDLDHAAIAPIPVPLTPAQLETLGLKPLSLASSTEKTDADRVDELLRQHCVGEGRDGLLVDTHEACKGAEDREEAVELLERVNQARAQLWHWMHEQGTSAKATDLRQAWRKEHIRGVVCGGWTQTDGGQWEEKKC